MLQHLLKLAVVLIVAVISGCSALVPARCHVENGWTELQVITACGQPKQRDEARYSDVWVQVELAYERVVIGLINDRVEYRLEL
jgi:hypothetical protein